MLKGWESRKGLSLGAKEAAMERIMSGLERPGGGPEALFTRCLGTGQNGHPDDVT